jgi:hypothetical protein
MQLWISCKIRPAPKGHITFLDSQELLFTMCISQLQTPTASVAMFGNSSIDQPNRQNGCLEITVLQLVDLPYQDLVPLGIQFSILTTTLGKKTTTTVWSGPPTKRLRYCSSFRFAPGVLDLVQPLKSLYHAKLKVEVVYDSNAGTESASANSLLQPITYLEAEFPLRQLCIGRPKDLSLRLRPTKVATTNNSCTTTVTTIKYMDDDETSHNDSATTVMVPELESPPTIRLHLNLLGPMRPTVQTVLYYFQMYLNVIDQVQDQLFSPFYDQVIKPILPVIPVGLGLGFLPIVTTAVVVSPVVIGISLLFFPITLPLLVLLFLLLSGGLGVVSILLCSTRQGRAMIDTNVIQHDFVQSLVATSPVTQSIIYDTGDDDAIPNPVSFLRWYVIPEGVWFRLLFSLTIDLVGSLSYLLPVLGESFDGPWVSQSRRCIEDVRSIVAAILMIII